MENNILELSALSIGIITLIYSVFILIKRRQVDKEMRRLIAEKKIKQEIDKYIRIRNANNHNNKRIVSTKEYLLIIKEINELSNKLRKSEKELFNRTLEMKNDSNRLNYLQKLLSKSADDIDFEKFDIIK